MVRATRSTLPYARAERPSFSTAAVSTRAPAASGVATLSRSRGPSAALVGAQPILWARAAWMVRAAMTRARTSAEGSPWAPPCRCATSTGGSTTCRSMRSSSGPESRAR